MTGRFRDRRDIEIEALMKYLGVRFVEERCEKCNGRKTDPSDFTNMTVCSSCNGDGVFIDVRAE